MLESLVRPGSHGYKYIYAIRKESGSDEKPRRSSGAILTDPQVTLRT